MNELKRLQHKYKLTSADFDFLNIKVKNENPFLMILISIGLATTILTPLLSVL